LLAAARDPATATTGGECVQSETHKCQNQWKCQDHGNVRNIIKAEKERRLSECIDRQMGEHGHYRSRCSMLAAIHRCVIAEKLKIYVPAAV